MKKKKKNRKCSIFVFYIQAVCLRAHHKQGVRSRGCLVGLKILSNILSNIIFYFHFISVYLCSPENSLKHEKLFSFILSQLQIRLDFSFATSKYLIQNYSRIKNKRGQKVFLKEPMCLLTRLENSYPVCQAGMLFSINIFYKLKFLFDFL